MDWKHKSVLKKEAVGFLNVKKGEVYIDATLGAAGHAREIIASGGRVIGFEVDQVTAERLRQEKIENLTVVEKNFTKIKEALMEQKLEKVAGALFDLGISSDQIESQEKGLSFNLDAPLDMRLDKNLDVRAADLLAVLNEKELYDLFFKYGEEYRARHIARAIVGYRATKKIQTTRELKELLEKLSPKKGKIHPATKVFMALRIVVNNELENLEIALKEASEVLKKEGRLVVISFHSLEDRIVKNFLKNNKNLRVLTKDPIEPGLAEVSANPRARSAKMRVAEKIN